MHTIQEVVKQAESFGNIYDVAINWQSKLNNCSTKETFNKMNALLMVMKQSIKDGLNENLRSVSGNVGGLSAKMNYETNVNRFGVISKACAYALAVAESNACMGKIVAAPTAGSCGIIPGVLFALQEDEDFSDLELTKALFTASLFGKVIAQQATVSGAQGGCQAECGSAAAMAAAAIVQLFSGTPQQCADACSFAIMNTLGLVCDPVNGLVEIPCVFRNVGAASQAFAAAQLALSGVKCPIPCDEMIISMKEIGDNMPQTCKETAEAGCATCPSMQRNK